MRAILNSWENTHATTKRHSWNAGMQVEAWDDITSILEGG